MSLSKFTKDARFQAVRRFTDRQQPQETFRNALAEIQASPSMKVLVYYGIGGVIEGNCQKKTL